MLRFSWSKLFHIVTVTLKILHIFHFIQNTHLDYFQYCNFYMTRILFYNFMKEKLGVIILGEWER